MLPVSTTSPVQSHPDRTATPKGDLAMSTVAATARPAVFSPEPSPEPASLLSPYHLGGLRLGNRMVLSPMTRSRALAGNVPNPLAAEYYAQRASAGLQITEG